MRQESRETPGPGQESVWDYPRPPRLERSTDQVTVTLGGVLLVSTTAAMRVLETSHPPTYYLPREAFIEGSLRAAAGSSYCEWKGQAAYLDICGGDRVAARAGWFYPSPTAAFAALAGAVALYPSMMDECRVNGELVQAQPGGFYGGWITARVVGPFKGEPGTLQW